MKNIQVIIFLVLWSSLNAWSQKIEEFKGKIKVSKEETANAKFDYIQNREEKVLDGEYQIEFNKRDSLFDLDFTKIIWKGKFKKNKRVGSWVFQQDDHLLTINDVDNFEVNKSLITERKILRAQYNNSRRIGDWQFNKQIYKDGAVQQELVDGKLSFLDNHLVSFFIIESLEEPFKVEGKFDDDGFLHGQWRFTYNVDSLKVEERRNYENGFLLNLLKTSGNDTLQYIVYDDVINKLKLLDNQPNAAGIKKSGQAFPLLFDQGYHPTDEKISAQKDANFLLQKKLAQMLVLDTSVSKNKPLLLRTTRFQFPVSDSFKKERRLAQVYTDSIKSLIHTASIDNFFEINRQKTDSMAWIYNYFQLVDKKVKSLDTALVLMKDDDFQYINKSIFFNNYMRFLNEADTIYYQYSDEEKVKLIDYQYYEVNDISQLNLYIKEHLFLVDSLAIYVNSELDKTMRSMKLEQLDLNILAAKAQVDSVFQQYDSVKHKGLLDHADSEFAVRKFNHYMQEYANTDQFEAKVQLGYKIEKFLSELEAVPERISNIGSTQNQIERAYTIKKFDPYTFNYDFETKQKKRLYDKAAVDLYNYLILLAKQEKKFNSFQQRLYQIEALQLRLLELLAEDTSRLERRIKRKDSPEEIMKLLELTTENND